MVDHYSICCPDCGQEQGVIWNCGRPNCSTYKEWRRRYDASQEAQKHLPPKPRIGANMGLEDMAAQVAVDKSKDEALLQLRSILRSIIERTNSIDDLTMLKYAVRKLAVDGLK